MRVIKTRRRRKAAGDMEFPIENDTLKKRVIRPLKGLPEMEALARILPDIIYRIDSRCRILYISEAVRQYGYTPDELMGRDIMELVHPEDRSQARHRINERRTGDRRTRNLNVRLLTKDRAVVHFEAAGGKAPACFFQVGAEGLYQSDIPKGETFMGTLGVARDITDRIIAEKERAALAEQLHRARKMEAIGMLAGGVAHDLNNILSGIVSYPDLLLVQIPENSPFRRPLEIIRKTGQKAADIVQDLLTLARRGVVTGGDVVCLNDIVEEYMDSPEYRKMLDRHPEVTVDAECRRPIPDLFGSRLHLSKSLMNLVLNAAEAITGPGRIAIATEDLRLASPLKGYETVPPGRYAVLRVADTGAGIDPDDMERIFEPFYTKKVMGRSGTGLGMSVVWGSLKDHGGYVDIRSRPGAGTEFLLYFPMTRKQPGRDEEAAAVDYTGRGESVLVVDDSQDQLLIASSILRQLGYSPITADCGEAAVAYLRKLPVDLVMLDMIMGEGMDGLQTYQAILTARPGQRAIIASGYSQTGRVRAAERLGVSGYVKKPYNLKEIGTAVRRALDAGPGWKGADNENRIQETSGIDPGDPGADSLGDPYSYDNGDGPGRQGGAL